MISIFFLQGITLQNVLISTNYQDIIRENFELFRAHCLYKILDSKKTSRFQFSGPGLREIHRNIKQQKNFNSHDGFFRKSPFCTFPCINPGFGGPWEMLWIFFLIGIFIMLQKNTFGKKNFKCYAPVQ